MEPLIIFLTGVICGVVSVVIFLSIANYQINADLRQERIDRILDGLREPMWTWKERRPVFKEDEDLECGM